MLLHNMLWVSETYQVGFLAVLCRNLRLLEFKAARTEPRAMRVIKMSPCLYTGAACARRRCPWGQEPKLDLRAST